MTDAVGFLTEPDGDVVATVADAGELAPLLILDRVELFLDRHGIGHGPIAWRRIGDGQSNVTFLLRRDGADVVLRRGPRPPLPRSTHDMLRESAVQSALRDAGFPVPRILAVCRDDELLGVPFYVMEFLVGSIVTDRLPADLDDEHGRRAISHLTVDTLADLHSLDVGAEPFASLGRPAGYLGRQVARFRELWPQSTTRALRRVDELADVLQERLPPDGRPALVHGDYRLGNLMLAPGAPARTLAVLDWEMATLGDPLADLGYLTATWTEAGAALNSMQLSPVTALPGFLDRDALIERYVVRTGADVDRLPWFQALALWKAAIFSEAIYTRWLRGERPEDTGFAPGLETGVPRLLEDAADFAARIPR